MTQPPVQTERADVPPLAAKDGRPISVLVVVPALISPVSIGILRPLRALELSGEIRLSIIRRTHWHRKEVERADVVVFCRAQSHFELRYLYAAKSMGKHVILEIDDNFFEIPLRFPIGRHHRHPVRLYALRRFYALTDITHVYNPIMADQVRRHGGSPKLIRSYFDARLVGSQTTREGDASRAVRVAFASARAFDSEFQSAIDTAMARLLEKYGARIEFHFWNEPPKSIAGSRQVKRHLPIANYDAFVRYFIGLGIDIGLAPLNEDLFHNSKTNNKYREYGGAGAAGVYSNTSLYRHCIRDGENGLLVSNTADAWVDAVSRLIDDRALRERIARAALGEITSSYSFAASVDMWRESFSSVMGMPTGLPAQSDRRPTESRLRLVFTAAATGKLSDHAEVLQAEGGRIEHLGDHSFEAILADRQFAAGAVAVTAPRSARDLPEALAVSAACAAGIISLANYSDDRDRLLQLAQLTSKRAPVTILAPAGLLPPFTDWMEGTTSGADIGLATKVSGDCTLIEWRAEPDRDPAMEEFSLSGEAAAFLEALDLMSARPDLAGLQTPRAGIARRIVRLSHRILARAISIMRSPNLSATQILVYAQAETEMFIWRHARFLKKL